MTPSDRTGPKIGR